MRDPIPPPSPTIFADRIVNNSAQLLNTMAWEHYELAQRLALVKSIIMVISTFYHPVCALWLLFFSFESFSAGQVADDETEQCCCCSHHLQISLCNRKTATFQQFRLTKCFRFTWRKLPEFSSFFPEMRQQKRRGSINPQKSGPRSRMGEKNNKQTIDVTCWHQNFLHLISASSSAGSSTLPAQLDDWTSVVVLCTNF